MIQNIPLLTYIFSFLYLDDHEEYQLVSWSKDQTLRLWKASKKTMQVFFLSGFHSILEIKTRGSLLLLCELFLHDVLTQCSYVYKTNTNYYFRKIHLKKFFNSPIVTSVFYKIFTCTCTLIRKIRRAVRFILSNEISFVVNHR